MAQNKAALTFDEIKQETQKLAAYLSICAKQPVVIRLQGHAGLAYTHSIEDDGKKHVIPMVLNPSAIEKIRNRERAVRVWWGLGAHELAHHLWPAAKFYELAYAEGFGRLFNLIDDEQNERRGRSEHPEWGEWFQSVMPLAFPKKQVFEGEQALTGGFGEENSWVKPGGFIADMVYIKRFNQFGYFLRRHNSEPNLVKDKAVAAALELIPARLKDLTKDELFEVTRTVHEALCRGINKPQEKVQFRNKPTDAKEKDESGETDNKEGEESKDNKDGKEDKDAKDTKPKDKPDQDEELREGEVKEGDRPANEEDTEERKKAKEEEEKRKAEEEKRKAEEEQRKEEDEKKRKEEREKKDAEKKSWDPRKLLSSKWMLLPLAAFIAGWCYVFSYAGNNFWLGLAFFIGQMLLIISFFIFLRWGAIKAFLLWMKRKTYLPAVRRFFLRKRVRRVAIPIAAAGLAWLAYELLLHFGVVTSFFIFGSLIFYIVGSTLTKLSIAAATSGGPPPNNNLLRVLKLATITASALIFYAIALIVQDHQLSWFTWALLSAVASFTVLFTLGTYGGIKALKQGQFAAGGERLTPGFRAMVKRVAAKNLAAIKTVLMHPAGLARFLGLAGLGAVRWSLALLWSGIKLVWKGLTLVALALASAVIWIWVKIWTAISFIWRRIHWGLSIAFRWTFTQIMRAWWFCSPTLKRLWKHTWFRLLIIAALIAAFCMMAYAVLLWVAHINFWYMVALIILLLILALLAFLNRKQLMKFIINELFQPMPSLMRQFIMPPLDMTTDWFLPVEKVEPVFADQAWLDKHLPEVIALSQQLRPIFANCGFAAIDRENQPEGFDLIDEIELALIGESSIFIDDETVPKPSLHIEFALDCSGSMGFATTSLGPGEKFELGKLMALAIENAVIGLPGVTAHFWGFRGDRIYDCGTPGQRRISGLTHGGGNNDSAMLFHMGQNAAHSGKNMKLLLMASDGMPAECSWLSLRNLVLRFEQEGMIPWNFGLDVIETRAFKNFTDLVGQSKPQAIQTFGQALSALAADGD